VYGNVQDRGEDVVWLAATGTRGQTGLRAAFDHLGALGIDSKGKQATTSVVTESSGGKGSETVRWVSRSCLGVEKRLGESNDPCFAAVYAHAMSRHVPTQCQPFALHTKLHSNSSHNSR
jgi:hypothetical protein